MLIHAQVFWTFFHDEGYTILNELLIGYPFIAAVGAAEVSPVVAGKPRAVSCRLNDEVLLWVIVIPPDYSDLMVCLPVAIVEVSTVLGVEILSPFFVSVVADHCCSVSLNQGLQHVSVHAVLSCVLFALVGET